MKERDMIGRSWIAPLVAVLVCMGPESFAQSDLDKDKTMPSCRRAAELRYQLDLVGDEQSYSIQSGKKAAACTATCMGLDVISGLGSAAAQCASVAESAWMKNWANEIKNGAAGLAASTSASAQRLCAAACPSNLPAISRTAAGVAAAYRRKKIGNPSSDDVEKIFDILVKTEGAKLTTKPLPQFKQELYQCVSDNMDNLLESYTKMKLKPQDGIILGLATCTEILRRKSG
jgi:hypothetical protein